MGQWEVPFLLVYIEKMVNSGIVYSCSQVKRNLSMWSIDVYTSWENNHNSHGFAYQKVNKFDIKFLYCFLRFMIITHHFTEQTRGLSYPTLNWYLFGPAACKRNPRFYYWIKCMDNYVDYSISSYIVTMRKYFAISTLFIFSISRHKNKRVDQLMWWCCLTHPRGGW